MVRKRWERLKRRNTFEDTSVTWPLESIKIRVSISLDDTQDPSSYLSPFLSQIRARLHEPMARLSIDIIVPVDTRRNIFRASLSLSLSLFHGERCNRVFPHHDTLKRCQVLDDGHSLPWPGHTGRQDIVHYHRCALVCFPPPRLLPFSPPSPPLQHFSSSSDFSLSIFAPRESGTGINFLTMFREGGERIVFSFEGFLTVAFLSRKRERLSNLMIDRSRSIETRKYKLELDF